MESAARPTWSDQNILFYAEISALCLGIGLLLWGLAPAIVIRLVTGQAMNPFEMPINLLTLLLGVTYVGLSLLMHQQRRWAYWSAFFTSATIGAAGVSLLAVGASVGASSFLLMLSAVSCFANWVALGALSRLRK